jgi:predicted MPP superfamily phosphohydrolase
MLAQIVAWRLWQSQFQKLLYRRAVTVIFILFNIEWIATLYYWRYVGEFGGTFLAWVARPAISWQALHAFFILPLRAALFLLWPLLLLGRRAVKALKARISDPDRPGRAVSDGISRRDFMKTTARVSFFGLIGFSGYAVFRQYCYPSVRRITLAVPNLPRALRGFRIAHLSDIHIGLWSTQKELEAAMAAARAEKPDLAVLTGDLVDRSPNNAALFEKPFKNQLSDVPFGVWGILGNHDHFVDPARITRILNGMGLNMLVDSRYNFPGLPLSLTGLDDRYHRMFSKSQNSRTDPDLLDFGPVRGPAKRAGDFKILLNHRPEGVHQAVRAGFDLYLAGHTHGGQYSFPGFDHRKNLAAFFYKYTAGLYPIERGWLNVSCGLASVGVPFRLFSWPEISLITLETA